jgi:hypothetical protein
MEGQMYKTDKRQTCENVNEPIVILDVRISCDTFWNYSFRIPIRINEYYDNNSINKNNKNNKEIRSSTCEIGRIGQIDPLFVKLETYLVDYVIQHIYEDLIAHNQDRDLLILLKKARKFHIHGLTLEDILFPNSNGHGHGNGHMISENLLYICTHC